MERSVVALDAIIAYDIASNRRRTRIAALLEGWGFRIQESVFQLSVSQAELAEIQRQLQELIVESDDVIHIYRLCRSCANGIVVLGTAPTIHDRGLYLGVW
ncbi:CRISPR-associated endonuclease Cas2 [Buchananella hordeovulneris]|uniref:CRISPR-associated endonuclease Cas2 n=1 Tax=Buchananella hordeovulneris TaxID=52770 RepID=UPI001FEE638B|nr:CRISPR-associated endonuclease Cas2 [Buchananella hordeovulneris]